MHSLRDPTANRLGQVASGPPTEVTLFVLLLEPIVNGRAIVHEARPDAPPEPWYLYQGRARCGLTVIVGADGTPEGAQADHCPAALEAAGREAVMRWRWVPDAGNSAEEVTISFPPPSQLPRRWDGERCLHAFRVTAQGAALEQDPTGSRRCAVDASGAVQAPVDFPMNLRGRAWCAVDVVAGAEGVEQAAVAWCPAPLTDEALATARSFAYAAREDTAYRVLLAYDPPRR